MQGTISTCPECGETFTKRTASQTFCKRKCYRKDYARKVREVSSTKQYPTYSCPNCFMESKLLFDPIKHHDDMDRVVCHYCKRDQHGVFKIEQSITCTTLIMTF